MSLTSAFTMPFGVSNSFVGQPLAVRQRTHARPRAVTTPAPSPPQPMVIEAMRHGNRVKHLGKPSDQRKALLRSLTTELIRYGRITTTLIRAKEVRKHADHIITLSKDGSLHCRRQAMAFIYDKQLVHALFEQAPDRYSERNGGYTRILRTMNRRGDNASMAVIELV